MKISVVIPTYNRAHIIKKSIESVLNQTIPPFEIIIVDDSSTDHTKNIVESLNNEKIKYVLNKRTKGANGARNTGMLIAKGDYIAFQDSDDLWLPSKLEKQINLMQQNPEISMCFCSLNIINKENTIIPNRQMHIKEIFQELHNTNFISTQTIFIKKKIAERYMFDEKLKRYQDWDFCLRVSAENKVGHINEPLVLAEIQEDSITSRVNGLEGMYQLYLRHPKLSEYNFNTKLLYYKVLSYKNRGKLIKFKYMYKYIYYKLRSIIS